MCPVGTFASVQKKKKKQKYSCTHRSQNLWANIMVQSMERFHAKCLAFGCSLSVCECVIFYPFFATHTHSFATYTTRRYVCFVARQFCGVDQQCRAKNMGKPSWHLWRRHLHIDCGCFPPLLPLPCLQCCISLLCQQIHVVKRPVLKMYLSFSKAQCVTRYWAPPSRARRGLCPSVTSSSALW